MPHADLLKIVEAGTRAPSGDNVQPWSFRAGDDRVEVLLVRGKDSSLYNHEERASLIAIGCLVENMRLRAAALGYEASLEVVPHDEIAARFVFAKGSPAPQPLSEFIEKRCSNRKAYEASEIPSTTLEALHGSVESDHVDLRIIQGERARVVARASAVNERIVLENRELHAFLFKHITWSEGDDERAPGFLVDTLELNAPQRAVFSIVKNWGAMRLANLVGISRLVAADNARLYASGPAVAAFATHSNTPEALVCLGMQIQHFWLTAASLGISAQPISGVSLLYERLRAGDSTRLEAHHQRMIRDAHRRIASALELRDEHLLFMLRLGFAPPPSARTRRSQPAITQF